MVVVRPDLGSAKPSVTKHSARGYQMFERDCVAGPGCGDGNECGQGEGEAQYVYNQRASPKQKAQRCWSTVFRSQQ
eukprot:1640840-Amphidinium_carterae.1